MVMVVCCHFAKRLRYKDSEVVMKAIAKHEIGSVNSVIIEKHVSFKANAVEPK